MQRVSDEELAKLRQQALHRAAFGPDKELANVVVALIDAIRDQQRKLNHLLPEQPLD